MKRTYIFTAIIALAAVLFTCKEDDKATPSDNNGGGGTGGGGTNTCSAFTDDVFSTHNNINYFKQISFAQGQRGFAVGKTIDNTSQHDYCIMQSSTSTHNKDWEVIVSSINLESVHDRIIFPNGSNAYISKGDAGHKKLYEIDLSSGTLTQMEYSSDIANTAPAMENMWFYAPTTYNVSSVAGLAACYQANTMVFSGYYVYMINTLSHDITNMIPVEVPNAFINEAGLPNIVTRAALHMFQDDSFVLGPIATADEDNMDYAFMPYDAQNKQWGAPTMVQNPGQDITNSLFFGLQDRGIFSNERGEEVIYIEHGSTNDTNINSMKLYKLTNKGTSIKPLPDLPPTLKEEGIAISFEENTQKGVIIGEQHAFVFGYTEDGGNTWKESSCPKDKIILMVDVAATSGSVFIGSNNVNEGNAGIIKVGKL